MLDHQSQGENGVDGSRAQAQDAEHEIGSDVVPLPARGGYRLSPNRQNGGWQCCGRRRAALAGVVAVLLVAVACSGGGGQARKGAKGTPIIVGLINQENAAVGS